MISHADDEGRISGNPKYIKGTVIPYKKWSEKLITNYLMSMEKVGLIHYWQEKDEWFIEFPKWKDHQTIRSDRFKPSKLPSFQSKNDNQPTTTGIPKDSQSDTQYNVIQTNEIKENKEKSNWANPKDFTPKTETEIAQFRAWEKLEPGNPMALRARYLKVQGVPPEVIRKLANRTAANPQIGSKGKEFDRLVLDYQSTQK
jgi:hypothetical protein